MSAMPCTISSFLSAVQRWLLNESVPVMHLHGIIAVRVLQMMAGFFASRPQHGLPGGGVRMQLELRWRPGWCR